MRKRLPRFGNARVIVSRHHSLLAPFGIKWTGGTELGVIQRYRAGLPRARMSVEQIFALLISGKAELLVDKQVWKEIVQRYRGKKPKKRPEEKVVDVRSSPKHPRHAEWLKEQEKTDKRANPKHAKHKEWLKEQAA